MKRFLSELPRSFQEIGQVAPSSRALARRLTAPLRETQPPRRILEVGPGTGSITKELLRLLGAGDILVVCEINSKLLEILKRDIERDREINQRLRQVEFRNMPVQELRAIDQPGSFDVIVSSLPFSNFDPQMVREILDLYRWLLVPGGSLSFYEYVGLRRAGQCFRSKRDRKRIREISHVIRDWKVNRALEGELKTSLTLLNLPPARTLVGKY